MGLRGKQSTRVESDKTYIYQLNTLLNKMTNSNKNECLKEINNIITLKPYLNKLVIDVLLDKTLNHITYSKLYSEVLEQICHNYAILERKIKTRLNQLLKDNIQIENYKDLCELNKYGDQLIGIANMITYFENKNILMVILI